MTTTAMIDTNQPKGNSKVKRQIKLKLVMVPMVLSMLTFLAANRSMAADAAPLKTKDVILVHGAWADGSCCSAVTSLLERRGFHVTAVQLSMTSISEDVATLKRALDLEPGPVLLVGHSYAGVVIAEAGNDPKVNGLVYISAYAPDTGETVSTDGNRQEYSDPQTSAQRMILGNRP